MLTVFMNYRGVVCIMNFFPGAPEQRILFISHPSFVWSHLSKESRFMGKICTTTTLLIIQSLFVSFLVNFQRILFTIWLSPFSRFKKIFWGTRFDRVELSNKNPRSADGNSKKSTRKMIPRCHTYIIQNKIGRINK